MQFQNMPNFRAISLDGEQQVGEKCKHKLYRASRPDFLTEREVEMFIEQLGIKSIVDFRSPKEYARSQAARLLDHHYGLHKVIVPSRFNNTDQVKWKPASPQTDVKEKRHYFINFFKFIYFRKIFKLAPWYFRLYSLLFLLVDFILDNGFKYFVRQFSKAVLNNMGLIGQYQYMIDYSQPSICSALKLLSDPSNLPALINCAHGKDRTGLVTAMVLAIGGKDKQFIAEDYAKSEIGLLSVRERVRSEICERLNLSEDFAGARKETMLQLLDYVENRYGSLPNYLEYIGFGREQQAKLRENVWGIH